MYTHKVLNFQSRTNISEDILDEIMSIDYPNKLQYKTIPFYYITYKISNLRSRTDTSIQIIDGDINISNDTSVKQYKN